MTQELTKDIIEKIADEHYNTSADDRLFSKEFNAQLQSKGYLNKAELVEIASWKSPRPKNQIAQNDDQIIELVTRRAFAEEDPRLAAWTLCYLYGVNTRMASAILTVYDQTKYTVMDVRALATLSNLDLPSLVGAKIPDPVDPDSCTIYGLYLETCKGLAEYFDVELRVLDRCLFAINGSEPQALLAAGN